MAGLWTSLTLLLLLGCATYAAKVKSGDVTHNDVIKPRQMMDLGKALPDSGGKPAKVSLGCAPDIFNNTRLTHHVFTSTHMSASQCIETCRRQHFKFAGVMDGVDCYCSNYEIRRELMENNMTADDTAEYCKINCPNNPSEQCGGQDSTALYTVIEDWRYFGCYQDSPGTPDLPNRQWGAEEEKSAHECVDTCGVLNFKFAGVQNGGECYCGNDYGTHGAEVEEFCNMTCRYNSRQNCGGLQANAIFMTERAHDMGTPGPDELITTLYDPTARTEISMGVFRQQPQLTSIITPKIAISASDSVVTMNQTDCQSNCYSSCGEIYHPEGFDHKGADLVLRLFHLNLRDLNNYVTEDTRRLFVYAQTVVMDASLTVDYAVLIRAREFILDQSQGTLVIRTDSGAPDLGLDFNVDLARGLDPNLIFMKQSSMCARILIDTKTKEDFNKAFAITEDIARTHTSDDELKTFINEIKMGMTEMAGVIRADVHYVPVYTKAHMSQILESYGTDIAVYKEDFDHIISTELTKREYLEVVDRMQKIYAETDIEEAKISMEASFVSVLQAEATLTDLHEEFLKANETMKMAEENFEKAMEDFIADAKKQATKYFFIAVGAAMLGSIIFGPGGALAVVWGLHKVYIAVVNLADVIEELARVMIKILDLLAEIKDLVDKIFDLNGDQSFMEYADDIEQMVELHSSMIYWQHLKDNVNIIMNDPDLKLVAEGADYHAAMLDLANWGESMSKTAIELAESTRIAMEKRLTYDAKVKQLDRLNELMDALRDDSIETEIVTYALMEQTYDVRMDLNGALLTFCQAYFYENLFECTNTYKPSFGGNLKDLLLKINAARKDALLVANVPSTVRRRVRIEDAASCDEMTMCPVRYFRQNRMFFYPMPMDHKDIWDLDKYRVAEVSFKFEGLKLYRHHADEDVNTLLKLVIESTGEFQGRSQGDVYNFLSRGLKLLYEYDIEGNFVTIKGDVYRPYRDIVSHVTPFTTWVVRVSEDRSYNIDVSDVTAITMTMTGSAVNGGA